ncbi:MAG: GNAT family N-acetyltransferase [Marinilabiliales bacterium]
MNINIRKAVKEDVPAILKLIKELAIYEKAPGEVTNTIEDLEKDGFSENPLYYVIVAEIDNEIVGMSFYFFSYSTWKGKCLYLDDIVVTEKYRGKGIGKILFEETIKVAKSSGAKKMHWQVLEWNEPAINFYKKYNTHFDGEWLNCKLSEKQLKDL